MEILILAVCVILALYSEKLRYFNWLSSVVCVMILGAFCRMMGWLPSQSPIYDFIYSTAVVVAIPMFLFRANWRNIYAQAGPILPIFIIVVISMILSAFAVSFIVHVGPRTGDLIAMLLSSYIGGSMNYVAVSKILEFNDYSLFAAGNAADNATMACYFILLSFIANLYLRRNYKTIENAENSQMIKKDLRILPIIAAVLLSIGFYLFAHQVNRWFEIPGLEIIIVSILPLIFAQLFQNTAQSFIASEKVGSIILLIFFAVIGVNSDIIQAIHESPKVLLITSIMLSLQLLITFAIAKIWKFNIPMVLIACNAAAGGSATAVAMASKFSWQELIIPAALCGSLGYAMGTFIATALAPYF